MHHDSILATYFQSNAWDRQQGKNWYHDAYCVCVNLAQKYGTTTDVVAGVIAALSPNNKWVRNVEDAETLLRAWAFEEPYVAAKVSTYTLNKDKATTILDLQMGRDAIITTLRGNKTIAFFLCIASDGDSDTPCIDGHAFNVWNGSVSSLKEVPSLSDKTFAMIQDAYRSAASIVSEVTGEHHSAAQVQAITWVAYRRLFKGLVD